MNATATSSQKEKETQKENKIQIKPETVVLLPNLIAHASITNVSEKKKSEKKMSASSINTTEKKMNLNTAEKKKAVAVAINTLINTVSVEKKKEKKTIEKLNKKIVVENVDCFITPTDDDVCYNALKNQKLLVKGVKIRYRHAQYTYKKKENDFCVGVIDRVRLSKSPSEKKRGDIVVCVYDEIKNRNDKLFFDDCLIWGELSVEPLHKILDGQIGWGGIKHKKKIWSWVKDYDTNYVVIVKEKKKGGGRKTHAQYKDDYMKGIIEMSKNKDDLIEALKTDGLLLEFVKNLTSTIKVNKSSKKIIGL